MYCIIRTSSRNRNILMCAKGNIFADFLLLLLPPFYLLYDISLSTLRNRFLGFAGSCRRQKFAIYKIVNVSVFIHS